MINNSRSRRIVQRDMTIGTHQSGISGRFPIPRNGLVGEWFLNWNALDTSGSGNNGTVINATFVNTEIWYKKQMAGEFNSAWVSTGNGRIELPSCGLWSACTEMSLSINFKCTNNNNTSTWPVSYDYCFSAKNDWLFVVKNGNAATLSFRMYSTPSYILECIVANDITASHNYIYTWSTTQQNAKLYKDNVLVATSSDIRTTSIALNQAMAFGGYPLINHFHWNIQTTRTYNRVLSEKERALLTMESLKLLH